MPLLKWPFSGRYDQNWDEFKYLWSWFYNQHVLIKIIVFDLERVDKGIIEQGVIPIDMLSAFDKNSNLSTLSLKC